MKTYDSQNRLIFPLEKLSPTFSLSFLTKSLILFCTLIGLQNKINAQIAAWTFNATDVTALNATTTPGNGTVSAISHTGLSNLGNQAAANGCGQSYKSEGHGGALNLTRYWAFTLTPNAGYTIDVTSISFNARIPSNGPQNYQIKYSLDSYASTLGSGNSIGTACSLHSSPITMDPTTSAVTFRIYFFGASNDNPDLRLDQLDVNGANVLPIELLNFSHSTEENQIILKWSTAVEKDNDYMAVERSINGEQFSEIGRVKGAGSSVERIDYSFIDQFPYKGTNYYRLRQVDFDGKTTFHKVIAAEFNGESTNTAHFLANPADNKVLVQFTAPGPGGQIFLVDAMGRIIRTTPFESQVLSATISTNGLPRGFYAVRLQRQDGQNKTWAFIK